MEDAEIIDLYWARDERAIGETDAIYGRRLHGMAARILQSREDAEESVSDTYMTAWNTIPPQRPGYFFAYLAKICRNFALSRLEWKNAGKRRAEVVSLTMEMELCIPDRSQDRHLEGEELRRVLNRFLESLSRENRLIFMRRYYYADSIGQIADRYGISQGSVKTRLHRIRSKLHSFLKGEGIYV